MENYNIDDEMDLVYSKITMTDENGLDIEFQLLYICEINDLEYVIMTNLEDDEDYIFEFIVSEDGEESIFRPVQDEKIIEKVVSKYMKEMDSLIED